MASNPYKWCFWDADTRHPIWVMRCRRLIFICWGYQFLEWCRITRILWYTPWGSRCSGCLWSFWWSWLTRGSWLLSGCVFIILLFFTFCCLWLIASLCTLLQKDCRSFWTTWRGRLCRIGLNRVSWRGLSFRVLCGSRRISWLIRSSLPSGWLSLGASSFFDLGHSLCRKFWKCRQFLFIFLSSLSQVYLHRGMSSLLIVLVFFSLFLHLLEQQWKLEFGLS